MSIPDKTTKYIEKDMLDLVIDQTAAKDGALSEEDFNKIIVAAQVQYGIDKYRADAAAMKYEDLVAESHDSKRLGEHLAVAGQHRPHNCHAHAIVAGKHEYAAILRGLMANLKIRIDDADNGCWLPENTAATPHPAFPNAVPHSRIHRYNYYFWLRTRLGSIREELNFRTTLQLTARHLQQGTFPEYVMLKKGERLPDGGQLA